ncbi:tetratricopeptide repeat protein, partial [Streptomyces sp. NPDC089919]|uniref:tetratricopeptide repeat protein n=1 Tax=Streptomyces sp. NPDC089919 TaxID=3155188 RepID=UPI00341B0DA5
MDDIADPADLIAHPGSGQRFSLWPPASPHGRVLLTTRCRDAALFGEGRRRIDVGLFTPEESLAYLTSALAAQDRIEPAGELAALADDLGHLPLALAQAVAYLIDAGETAADYRQLLADRTTTLHRLAPATLPDEQATALAAAWSLSIDRADTLQPAGLARPMLQLAAFLDPNGIPQNVLTSETARAYLTTHRTNSGDSPQTSVSSTDAVRALRALHRLCLIDHQPTNPDQAVHIHQLIQHATRDTLTPDQHHQSARTAASALRDAWPVIERDTDVAQALRANTSALVHHAEDSLYEPDAHAVLYRLGRSLGESGQVTAAAGHFWHLAAAARNKLGDDHPNTLTARSNLAAWRGTAGDAAGAAQAYADLLEPVVRVLGEDHPNSLTTRNNLAYWRGQAGDAAGAAQAFAELLSDLIRVLGEDHPDTLTARGNLATWRGTAGDTAGAA